MVRLPFGRRKARASPEMEEEKRLVCAAYVVMSCAYLKMKQRKKFRKRRCWMLSLRNRKTKEDASSSTLPEDLNREPSGQFEHFCKMSGTDLDDLLTKIGPLIKKADTNMRRAIPAKERLLVTLRYLTSGDNFKTLSRMFKFSNQIISLIVDDVCSALNLMLEAEIRMPTSSEEWLNIAKEYEEKWDFPHCVGAIGGKHVLLSQTKSGLDLLHDEGPLRFALIALVDGNYCFTFVDIGYLGRSNESCGVFGNSTLFKMIDQHQLSLPLDQPLPTIDSVPMPYVFVADNTFGCLSERVMIPYSGTHELGSNRKVFNYRLSRVSRVAENALGVLASVFRVLRRPLLFQPEKASNIVMACILLHNYLRKSETSSSCYSPEGTFDIETQGELIPGSWRKDENELTSLLPLYGARRKPEAKAVKVRDAFAEYFKIAGKIPLQDDC